MLCFDDWMHIACYLPLLTSRFAPVLRVEMWCDPGAILSTDWPKHIQRWLSTLFNAYWCILSVFVSLCAYMCWHVDGMHHRSSIFENRLISCCLDGFNVDSFRDTWLLTCILTSCIIICADCCTVGSYQARNHARHFLSMPSETDPAQHLWGE